MKDRYPFLFSWKQNGFDKFPLYPIQAIVEKSFNKGFEKVKRDPGMAFVSRLLGVEETVKAFGHLAGCDLAINRLEEKMIDEVTELGIKALEMKDSVILKGADRKEELSEFGKKSLPSTQGGKIIFTRNQCVTLKHIHKEMQNCIKEVRMELEIPLRGMAEECYKKWEKWDKPKPEDIISRVPGILDIFKEKEFPLLVEWPLIGKSKGNASYEIICKRLNPCLRLLMKPRTLKSVISRIKSI